MTKAPDASTDVGLRFSFADMLSEIDAMAALAARQLDQVATASVIPEWKRKLEHFRLSPGDGKLTWAIPMEEPLRTVCSNGEYQRGSKGKHMVHGELSAVWELSLDNNGSGKQKRPKHFILSGNASTLVRIVSEEAQAVVKEWHFDIGVADSPGCHFHAHIDRDKDEDGIASLDVPRLPTFLITPMDALEFLVAELFQDEWPKHAIARVHKTGWGNIQRKRLRSVLEWHLKEISTTTGSPWTSFKTNCKPPADLLLSRS